MRHFHAIFSFILLPNKKSFEKLPYHTICFHTFHFDIKHTCIYHQNHAGHISN